MTDEELIQWFADLKVGDTLPRDFEERVQRIEALGIVSHLNGMGLGISHLRMRDACRQHLAGRLV